MLSESSYLDTAMLLIQHLFKSDSIQKVAPLVSVVVLVVVGDWGSANQFKRFIFLRNKLEKGLQKAVLAQSIFLYSFNFLFPVQKLAPAPCVE